MLLKLCAVVAVEKKRAPGTPGVELEGVAQLDGERKRSVHSSRSWARTLHSEKAFGMPFAARALIVLNLDKVDLGTSECDKPPAPPTQRHRLARLAGRVIENPFVSFTTDVLM